MHQPSPLVLFSLLLALGTSCSSSPPDAVSATGAVHLAASSRQALSSSEISRVTVTSSAADMPSITIDLVQMDGVWGGVIGNIPVGAQRIFHAQAFDSAGSLQYEGHAENVTVVADEVTLVTLTLQEVAPPTPYENQAPLIDSVVAAPLGVEPGGSITLVASAHDPNPGDMLVYAWTAGAGGFSAPSEESTTWSAPSQAGPVTLTLTVIDDRGAASSVSLTVNVSAREGGAELDVRFNSHPVVVLLTSSQSNLQVGQSTVLTVSAADSDGDELSYEWSASCAGNLEGADTSAAHFTPTSLPASACNNCQLRVLVSDGRGGQTVATLSLCVAEANAVHLPPVVVRSYQSSLTARAGQQLTFEVVARDPGASLLAFTWSAVEGALGPSVDSSTTSRVTWTAPACASDGTSLSLSATVTNGFGLTASRTFSVSGLPACSPSGTWAYAGPMVEPRIYHSATLLPSGKVLATGGNGAGGNKVTAELYDPATGTWTDTGSMRIQRVTHSATLLPSGKVLVTGGHHTLTLAELYDPVSGTWASAGSTSVARENVNATLLPSGRVLVTGGASMVAEVYDPIAGTWTPTGALSLSRYGHSATLLPSGKVLVVGSSGAGGNTAEVYDPATGTWAPIGSLSFPRGYGHRATLLPSGKVLVTGGSSGGGNTAELYDPATGTWAPTGSMSVARYGHSAMLLPSGKVLVVGSSGDGWDTAELYDPTTGTWSPTMNSSQSGHTSTLLPFGKVLIVSRNPALYTP
ncbi:kelch repeat-containing protein [Stigmatella sp. ncwal1]|uniref:Kelch repeat-containing protein n=1 Tax=Stigmatella ashevillensis TaxID=2995309 RepID=A0ABT5DHH7_9BACT|nr:kelch repeat-containing protein [Stigmatella ashevillena]MDC0713127.1 kelch repeat-containing protein [Stigmatella ashevillena]